MATRRQTVVSRISELERANEANNNEIKALKRELSETPAALLERDPDAETMAQVKRKNNFLRAQGMIPK